MVEITEPTAVFQFPFETPVLRVEQPMGTFYVAILPAELLLRVAESDVMSATLNPGGVGYTLSGTQRAIQDRRLSQIGAYIDRLDAAFPNAIILAANHSRAVGLDLEEAAEINAEATVDGDDAAAAAAVEDAVVAEEWAVTLKEDGSFRLRIPTEKKLAAIIDGQHRLFGFARAKEADRLEMQLICAIFLDLPKPFQAQLFATINSTQKAVDRSLTYELFGYNVSEEREEFWTPDKLAVFLARKLGTDTTSPLKGKITVSPKRDALLEQMNKDADWKVSTAVVVDGIIRLISTNARRDTNLMLSPTSKKRPALSEGPKDRSPLREAFIEVKDEIIYRMVENYLSACKDVWWTKAKAGSFIVKTVGLQAQFDILRALSAAAYIGRDVSQAYFAKQIAPAAGIDFSTVEFKNASGSGRSFIRRKIAAAMGLL